MSRDADNQRLAEIAEKLADEPRRALLEYAEFLFDRHGAVEADGPPPAPEPIPRPERESVVAAVKRLSATYPMVERGNLLNETSMLVTQHVMYGRNPMEVIDELEALFERHYRRLLGDDV